MEIFYKWEGKSRDGGTREGGEEEVRQIKMYYVYVATPHDKYNHMY